MSDAALRGLTGRMSCLQGPSFPAPLPSGGPQSRPTPRRAAAIREEQNVLDHRRPGETAESQDLREVRCTYLCEDPRPWRTSTTSTRRRTGVASSSAARESAL